MLRKRQSRGSLPSIKITPDEEFMDSAEFTKRRGSLSPKEGRRSLSPGPSSKGGLFSELAKKVEMNRIKALDSPLLRASWRKLSRSKQRLDSGDSEFHLPRSLSDYSVYENSVAVDINGNCDTRLSEVFSAVRDNNCKKLKSILKGGQVNVNNLDINGISPQHEASFQGFIKCLKILRSNGADLNFQDSSGWTSLHAAICGEKSKCVKFLLSSGVRVNTPDLTGWSALHFAVYLGNRDLVNVLVKYGGDVLFEAPNGLTPFQLALDMKQEKIIRYFFDLAVLLVR